MAMKLKKMACLTNYSIIYHGEKGKKLFFFLFVLALKGT
jgi:hypothetical protein